MVVWGGHSRGGRRGRRKGTRVGARVAFHLQVIIDRGCVIDFMFYCFMALLTFFLIVLLLFSC